MSSSAPVSSSHYSPAYMYIYIYTCTPLSNKIFTLLTVISSSNLSYSSLTLNVTFSAILKVLISLSISLQAMNLVKTAFSSCLTTQESHWSHNSLFALAFKFYFTCVVNKLLLNKQNWDVEQSLLPLFWYIPRLALIYFSYLCIVLFSYPTFYVVSSVHIFNCFFTGLLCLVSHTCKIAIVLTL